MARPGAEITWKHPNTYEWGTPQSFFDSLNEEFRFTLDVAATYQNAKCLRFFTIEDDGLSKDWSGERCWMNPPYGRDIKDWVKKAYEESIRGALVVALVPSRTDTHWWHEYAMKARDIRFVKGRLSFTEGHKNNPGSHNATFPSAVLVYWR
jgi:site-specific DNA-methyltransferase (adenine-specific)